MVSEENSGVHGFCCLCQTVRKTAKREPLSSKLSKLSKSTPLLTNPTLLTPLSTNSTPLTPLVTPFCLNFLKPALNSRTSVLTMSKTVSQTVSVLTNFWEYWWFSENLWNFDDLMIFWEFLKFCWIWCAGGYPVCTRCIPSVWPGVYPVYTQCLTRCRPSDGPVVNPV